MTAKITPKYVTLGEAAVYAGYSQWTLREEILAGRLPAYRMNDRPGAQFRIRLSDIDAMLKPVIPEAVTATKGGAK